MIENAIAEIQTKAKRMPGIKAAPAHPPKIAGDFPFVVTYLRNGRLNTHSHGFGDYLDTIVTEIHVAGQLLAEAIETALPFRSAFSKAVIADPTLNGTVSTVNEIRYTFGALVWGNVKTIGYRFEIDVKSKFTWEVE